MIELISHLNYHALFVIPVITVILPMVAELWTASRIVKKINVMYYELSGAKNTSSERKIEKEFCEYVDILENKGIRRKFEDGPELLFEGKQYGQYRQVMLSRIMIFCWISGGYSAQAC